VLDRDSVRSRLSWRVTRQRRCRPWGVRAALV